MTPLRLLMISDRIWPVVDVDAIALEQMGQALAERGHLLSVWTRRWSKFWPDRLSLGSLMIERLPFAANSRFGRLRLSRWMQRALAARRDDFDAWIVRPADELALFAAKAAADIGTPICFWQCSVTAPQVWRRTVDRIRRAVPMDRVEADWIVAHPDQADALIRIGVAREQITCLELVLDWPEERRLSRTEARQALAHFQGQFEVGPDEPLVLGVGHWTEANAGVDLLNAWRRVRRSFPRGRLWIIGTVPPAAKMVERIRRLDLYPDVVLTGWFDNWNELLSSADIVVQAEPLPGPHLLTRAAMQRGLEVVACAADPDAAAHWRAAGAVASYPPGEPTKLADDLIDTIHLRENRYPGHVSRPVSPWNPVELPQAVASFEWRAAQWIQQQEKVQH